jgi:hypothetical protein
MKTACIILLIVFAVLVGGCTTAAPAASPLPTSTTAATPAIPNLIGTWTGLTVGYVEGTGYTNYPNVTMTMVISEQHDRIFSGVFLWKTTSGKVTDSTFAGAISRDGMWLDIVEKDGGYSTGEIISKNEMELTYTYDGSIPYSIAIDSLKRV